MNAVFKPLACAKEIYYFYLYGRILKRVVDASPDLFEFLTRHNFMRVGFSASTLCSLQKMPEFFEQKEDGEVLSAIGVLLEPYRGIMEQSRLIDCMALRIERTGGNMYYIFIEPINAAGASYAKKILASYAGVLAIASSILLFL